MCVHTYLVLIKMYFLKKEKSVFRILNIWYKEYLEFLKNACLHGNQKKSNTLSFPLLSPTLLLLMILSVFKKNICGTHRQKERLCPYRCVGQVSFGACAWEEVTGSSLPAWSVSSMVLYPCGPSLPVPSPTHALEVTGVPLWGAERDED